MQMMLLINFYQTKNFFARFFLKLRQVAFCRFAPATRGTLIEDIFEKKSHSAEKNCEEGDPLVFSTTFTNRKNFLVSWQTRVYVLRPLRPHQQDRNSALTTRPNGSEKLLTFRNAQSCQFPGLNKPGTAQVGAISKAQKYENDFKVSSILFHSIQKNARNWSELARPFEFFNIHFVAKYQK